MSVHAVIHRVRGDAGWVGLLASALLLTTLPGPAASAELHLVRVDAGAQSVVQTAAAVRRAAVADPGVADAEIVSSREVLVTGKTPGSTSLLLWLAGAAESQNYDVTVDAPGLGAPGSLPAQVQIDTRIMELSRRALRQAGINATRVTSKTAVSVSPPGTLSGISKDGMRGFLVDSASGFLPMGQAFNLLYGNGKEDLMVTVSVLEQNGLAHTLAEPTLVAMSGQTASFLAGGEFPVPVVQSSGGSNSVTIEYKPFGIRLMVTPTVLSSDRIALKVAPEVSELDFTSGVTASGVSVPGLTTRRADTTVELGDGESFAISGLVTHRLNTSVDKVPWLGDIPVLGAIFKSTRFEREDREVLMLVSPHLVRPLASQAEDLPLPGEEFRDYVPGLIRLQTLERGHFDPEGAGFSR